MMQNMHELMEKVSFDELAAFIAVVESHGFATAANVLGRDPTILSRRVSQLENKLGVKLLSRTTRKVSLTEVGAIYYGRVRALMDEFENANTEAGQLASSPQGLLRISLPSTFGRLWMAPLLSQFMVKHPKIKIDARFSDRIVDLVAEHFDVAIRVGTLRSSTLKARKLASFKYVLVAAPDFIRLHGTPETPEDLERFACLGFTHYSFWPDWKLIRAGQRKTLRPEGPYVTDNSEAMLQAAIDGLGIALAADWLAGPAMRSGHLQQVLPGWQGDLEGGIYAIMPPGQWLPTKTRLFVDEMSAAVSAGWYGSEGADTGTSMVPPASAD